MSWPYRHLCSSPNGAAASGKAGHGSGLVVGHPDTEGGNAKGEMRMARVEVTGDTLPD